MLNRTRLSLTVALAAAIMLTGGCTRIRDHKGYVADQLLIDAIQPGIDNRESVEKTLGKPSFGAQFGDDTWYYLSRETKQLAFARPKPVAQTALAIHFDRNGNVDAIQKRGLEKVAKLSPDGDRTPTLGRERGFFRELFGNIGRVGSVGEAGGTADNPD